MASLPIRTKCFNQFRWSQSQGPSISFEAIGSACDQRCLSGGCIAAWLKSTNLDNRKRASSGTVVASAGKVGKAAAIAPVPDGTTSDTGTVALAATRSALCTGVGASVGSRPTIVVDPTGSDRWRKFSPRLFIAKAATPATLRTNKDRAATECLNAGFIFQKSSCDHCHKIGVEGQLVKTLEPARRRGNADLAATSVPRKGGAHPARAGESPGASRQPTSVYLAETSRPAVRASSPGRGRRENPLAGRRPSPLTACNLLLAFT